MLTKTEFGVLFSISTRVSSGIKTSFVRVITTLNWDSRNFWLSRVATSRVTVFSGGPYRREAPLSRPPWPASTTTVVKERLVFFTCCCGGETVPHPARKSAPPATTIPQFRPRITIDK
jgi:hypothetical protein